MSDNVQYGERLQFNLYDRIDDVFQVGDDNPEYSKGINSFLYNIAQSRYFTLTLDKLTDNSGIPIKFKLGKPSANNYAKGKEINTFNDFFPVKNVSINHTSYHNMSVPFSVFGNIPLLHSASLPKITINAYDLDDDRVERAVSRWTNICFPNDRYVAYLSNAASKFEYISYDVTGRENFTFTFYVIPSDNVIVSRSYEENNEKIVSFSVVAVGAPGASSKGSSPLSSSGTSSIGNGGMVGGGAGGGGGSSFNSDKKVNLVKAIQGGVQGFVLGTPFGPVGQIAGTIIGSTSQMFKSSETPKQSGNRSW